MRIEEKLIQGITKIGKNIYHTTIDERKIQIQKTRKEFTGDITVVVFPLLPLTKKSPEITGNELGEKLMEALPEITGFNVIKGFLNLTLSDTYYLEVLAQIHADHNFGQKSISGDELIMLEYSSPNTNKPLHLGHIRNNLLGYAMANILEANGKKVIKTNLVNDRGIHICKSMLAWQKWGHGETPESSGMKGDHLVGDYYVKFDQEYKKQMAELVEQGQSAEEATNNAPIIIEARDMLRKWEENDPEIQSLWKTMNGWVYDGFDETYHKLGVDFDKIYYESDTYLAGKEAVEEGLQKGIFHQRADKSVWIDLSSDGLDQKLLLRSDGTSVYITQDIGTAQLRHKDYPFNKLIYVVGNEQEYHFKVLALIMNKLGYSWAKNLHHLSYGMVELPEGKMKSREGTVVDADDLIQEMIDTARDMSVELGKLNGYTEEQKENTFRIIGMGALKYFILKVDPSKNMTFNPKESVDFNGNTGPFIQYTFARIKSVFRKAEELSVHIPNNTNTNFPISEKERSLIKQIMEYPEVIAEAGNTYNPALIANYLYDLVKEYNQFYHDHPILKEPDKDLRNLRIILSKQIDQIIFKGMGLLGIEVPVKM